MKILIQGNKDRLKKHKKFNCTYCGCVFVADSSEYEDKSNQREGPMFLVKCPCCKYPVWCNSNDCVELCPRPTNNLRGMEEQFGK